MRCDDRIFEAPSRMVIDQRQVAAKPDFSTAVLGYPLSEPLTFFVWPDGAEPIENLRPRILSIRLDPSRCGRATPASATPSLGNWSFAATPGDGLSRTRMKWSTKRRAEPSPKALRRRPCPAGSWMLRRTGLATSICARSRSRGSALRSHRQA